MAKNVSFSSLFNLQPTSINFNIGHLWAKYQGYSLTLWPKMDQFHHLSTCNQNDLISSLVMFGQYIKVIALRFGEKWPIFITFQSATKINLNFGHLWAKYQGYSLTFWPKIDQFHHFSTWNQNDSMSILVMFGQNIKVIALRFGEKWPIFITCQSAFKIN